VQKAARWPCGVCGRYVGSNSIQCTSCHKWVHKKCSGIKGSMYKVMRSLAAATAVVVVVAVGCCNNTSVIANGVVTMTVIIAKVRLVPLMSANSAPSSSRPSNQSS